MLPLILQSAHIPRIIEVLPSEYLALINTISDLRHILEVILQKSIDILEAAFIATVFNGLLV